MENKKEQMLKDGAIMEISYLIAEQRILISQIDKFEIGWASSELRKALRKAFFREVGTRCAFPAEGSNPHDLGKELYEKFISIFNGVYIE